jgi:hypothetical protein
MSKFIVFTVDHDEQQSFVDFTKSSTSENALSQVLHNRGYCCHGVAYTPDELRQLADNCEKEDA